MKRANETMTMFMTEQKAVEDRKLFVRNLGWLLSQTRDQLVSCELVNAGRDNEHVVVTYKGGMTRKICTHLDSYAAIVRDVAKYYQ